MRILHVDPAATWRGGERQVLLLARELARRGHECVVAGDPRSPLVERADRAGLSVRGARIRGDGDPIGIARVARLLREIRPDVLHLHTARAHAAGGIAARLVRSAPVLVTRRLELPVRGVLGRWKYRALGDHYIAISRAVARSLRSGGVPADRVTLVPSGVDLAGVVPRPARLAAAPPVIGTLAAVTPQKDPATWVRACRLVAEARPDVRFVWAGTGELARELAVAVEEAGLADRVRLPGFVEDVESFWREIDVFFLPSAFEALGTVLLDALARGVPIVATDVGGIPEVVRDGREGLLAPRGDAEALASAVGRVLADPDLSSRLSSAGPPRAREFEIGRLTGRVEDVYARLHSSAGRETA